VSVFWKQTLEACLWTFAETFAASLAAGIAGITVGDWDALYTLAGTAGLSALAAVISVIKSIVVRNVGESDSIFIAS